MEALVAVGNVLKTVGPLIAPAAAVLQGTGVFGWILGSTAAGSIERLFDRILSQFSIPRSHFWRYSFVGVSFTLLYAEYRRAEKAQDRRTQAELAHRQHQQLLAVKAIEQRNHEQQLMIQREFLTMVQKQQQPQQRNQQQQPRVEEVTGGDDDRTHQQRAGSIGQRLRQQQQQYANGDNGLLGGGDITTTPPTTTTTDIVATSPTLPPEPSLFVPLETLERGTSRLLWVIWGAFAFMAAEEQWRFLPSPAPVLHPASLHPGSGSSSPNRTLPPIQDISMAHNIGFFRSGGDEPMSSSASTLQLRLHNNQDYLAPRGIHCREAPINVGDYKVLQGCTGTTLKDQWDTRAYIWDRQRPSKWVSFVVKDKEWYDLSEWVPRMREGGVHV